MKARYLLLGVALLSAPIESAPRSVKENIKEIAATAGQKIKEAGRYITKIPHKVRIKVDSWLADYWENMPALKQVAQVRAGISLPPGEKKAVADRLEHVAHAVKNKLNKEKYIPKIALLFSGGGYRAMADTIGFLAGAQKEGLLDMVTWMGGVSGGAWGMASVLTKAQQMGGDIDIADFAQEQARSLANKSLKPTENAEYKEIGKILMAQAMGHQLFTSVNIFGSLLANRLFGFLPVDKRQRVLLSQQEKLVESGAWPIPIYTVVQYDIGLPISNYRWVEFNPWEYGGTWLHSYAPIWATSRSFCDGVSTNFYPERSLGFILGICGSAFALEYDKAYEMIKEGLYPFVRSFIEKSVLPRYALSRVTWGQLSNYSKGLSVSLIKDEDYLNLIDAGFTCNLPYPPLSGERPDRKPDILILMDSSTTPLQALQATERYARKHKLKFPCIDYNGIDKKYISVFYDPEDRDVPVVIYLWRMTDPSLQQQLDSDFAEYAELLKGFDINTCINQGTCSFTNFVYPERTMLQLMRTIEFQTRAVMPTIFDTIKLLINRKTESWIDRVKFW